MNGTIETTPLNEDFLLTTFDGHSADILARENNTGGTSAATLDGQTIAASQYNGVSVAQSPMFSTLTTSLLPAGRHSLRLTKKRGSQMNVDALRVYKQWPSGALHWQGDTSGNFDASANWLENE